MKKCIAAAMAVALTFGLAACGNDSASDKGTNNSASAGDAKKLVDQKCSACHGRNLEGNVGPSLEKIGSKMNEKQILDVIENGKGDMPKGILKGDDAKKVAKWLSQKK
ncbi:cytochrome c551 [Heyndrickxia acidiproducens]|uniref:cytochrome c551 n=1 Tax=Heyndrickxia acidiproducens TaxID=1121084 RepID=UPI00036EE545|nr:cytochrome c [Heyndrickxia acidiproducens]